MNAFVRPARHAFLPIDEIDLSHTIRPYNATAVAELAQSIRAIGLQTPLTCVIRDGRHILVAGRNRLEAQRGLRFYRCAPLALSKLLSVSSTSATLRPPENKQKLLSEIDAIYDRDHAVKVRLTPEQVVEADVVAIMRAATLPPRSSERDE
jgi:hypothetical protein